MVQSCSSERHAATARRAIHARSEVRYSTLVFPATIDSALTLSAPAQPPERVLEALADGLKEAEVETVGRTDDGALVFSSLFCPFGRWKMFAMISSGTLALQVGTDGRADALAVRWRLRTPRVVALLAMAALLAFLTWRDEALSLVTREGFVVVFFALAVGEWLLVRYLFRRWLLSNLRRAGADANV
jgi:hypothetical protein